jgi:[ribosomal protein S5]-alanine N-acetyltransferase
MNAEFVTARLIAEPLDLALHEEELARLHADPRVMATMGGTRDRDQNRVWIERNARHAQEEGFGVFVFRDRTTGDTVGKGAIRRTEIGGSVEVEIGYAVAAEFWGRGLATELGAWLVAYAEQRGYRELVAFTQPENARSRRVMEKLGFRYEREVDWQDDAYVLYRRRPADREPAGRLDFHRSSCQ